MQVDKNHIFFRGMRGDCFLNISYGLQMIFYCPMKIKA